MQESKRGKKKETFSRSRRSGIWLLMYPRKTQRLFFSFPTVVVTTWVQEGSHHKQMCYRIQNISNIGINNTQQNTKTQIKRKVDSGISQHGSCAPNEAHMLSPLHLETETVGHRHFHSYIVQGALFLLESSLSFALLWFFLSTELFQSPHLLFEVLMLISKRGRKEKVCSISWNI